MLIKIKNQNMLFSMVIFILLLNLMLLIGVNMVMVVILSMKFLIIDETIVIFQQKDVFIINCIIYLTVSDY